MPKIEIGILQHPSEQKQTKGTARLAALSIQNAHLWVGELLTDAELSVSHDSVSNTFNLAIDNSLIQWIAQKPTLLLYPETEEVSDLDIKTSEIGQNLQQSTQRFDNSKKLPAGKVCDLTQINELNHHFQVLVLDGTWRKTHKMLMLNPELQVLPRIAISPNKASSYQIRKQKNHQSLATIEAIAELLRMLEPEAEPESDKAEKLHLAFEQMQQFLLSLRVAPNRLHLARKEES